MKTLNVRGVIEQLAGASRGCAQRVVSRLRPIKLWLNGMEKCAECGGGGQRLYGSGMKFGVYISYCLKCNGTGVVKKPANESSSATADPKL